MYNLTEFDIIVYINNKEIEGVISGKTNKIDVVNNLGKKINLELSFSRNKIKKYKDLILVGCGNSYNDKIVSIFKFKDML